jgi:hypothetical protein
MTRPNTEQDFWRSVDRDGPQAAHMKDRCWLWTREASRVSGYGRMPYRGRLWLAHRLSWVLAHGAPAQFVLHHCDNRICVRPSHLYQGTHADNARDKSSRGRVIVYYGDEHWSHRMPDRVLRGERNGRAKLSDVDSNVIRASTESTSVLVRRYGVCRSTIKRLRPGFRAISPIMG